MDISILAQIDTDTIMTQFNLFLQTLRPDSLGDVLIYVVFFVCLITTFILPDGNEMAGNLLYLTLVLCIFNLTVGQEWIDFAAYEYAFPAFAAQVGMAVIPFIAAGASRKSPKGRKGGAALPLAIVAGFVGIIFVIGFQLVRDVMNAPLF
ncbi:MAG: hypothetical protein AAFV98_01620 [Chloroflexota bacterium]